MGKEKRTQSEIDGVQYRRAKLWQIILISCNSLVGMSVYSLIGYASYSANIGYGIATAMVGVILTCTRILDGVTDPMLATGGSACDALKRLKDDGYKSIRLMCLVASPQGVKAVQEQHPDVDIYLASLDEGMNDKNYILPGLGDAGDRIFGTR